MDPFCAGLLIGAISAGAGVLLASAIILDGRRKWTMAMLTTSSPGIYVRSDHLGNMTTIIEWERTELEIA